MALVVKNPPANAEDSRDLGLIPGLEDPLEERAATNSSILAWKIPWTEEPGGLQSIGSQRVRHDWIDLAHMQAVFLWAWETSDQIRSVTQSCPTLCDPWIAARQASLSITNSWSSLRLTSIESVMPSSYLILCRPLLLLPPIPPSIRVNSSNEVATVLEFQL